MENLIEKIYELYKSPITTPYNLLENALLPNYEYVKYYKGTSGLIAEMKCEMDNTETIFHYQFDNEYSLQVITMEQDGKKEVKFERSTELDKLKKAFIEQDNKFKNIK